MFCSTAFCFSMSPTQDFNSLFQIDSYWKDYRFFEGCCFFDVSWAFFTYFSFFTCLSFCPSNLTNCQHIKLPASCASNGRLKVTSHGMVCCTSLPVDTAWYSRFWALTSSSLEGRHTFWMQKALQHVDVKMGAFSMSEGAFPSSFMGYILSISFGTKKFCVDTISQLDFHARQI